jgi:Ca2+-binding RTX toxin-like protein
MADLTAREQLMLELINRACMNPRAEAERLDVALGEGQGRPVPVLAGNDVLKTAAYNHSGWMLLNDDFTSIESAGSHSFIAATPIDRIVAYGYGVSGRHRYGENISWVGDSTAPDFTAAIIEQYESLFATGAGRGRMLKPAFQEVGIGQQAGEFSDGGQTYIASMVTQDFIRSGAKTFITGVVYSDTTDNDFYDVGEAIAGRKVKAAGAAADRTGPGGGYELQFGEAGIASMRFKQPGRDLELDVALGADNVKVDAVNGREIWTNGSVQSQSKAIAELHALGVSPLVLIGSDVPDEITGNRAANQLLGLGGSDTINGKGGKDGIMGGYDSDVLTGGRGADLFVFVSRKDSRPAAPDTITDFGTGRDRIDLGGLYESKLKYRDETEITGAHQVNVTASGGDVIVHVNLDHDAFDELQIILSGTALADMTKGDFML